MNDSSSFLLEWTLCEWWKVSWWKKSRTWKTFVVFSCYYNGASFFCACPAPYTGVRCEVDPTGTTHHHEPFSEWNFVVSFLVTNQCNSNPPYCKNGGTYVLREKNVPRTWILVSCSTSCISLNNAPFCLCPQPYTGPTCLQMNSSIERSCFFSSVNWTFVISTLLATNNICSLIPNQCKNGGT